MASLDQVSRSEKCRVATEIHDNLVIRATTVPADSILDPFITKSATGADIDIVEESKRLIEPLTNAVRHLRTQARTRATKRKHDTTP